MVRLDAIRVEFNASFARGCVPIRDYIEDWWSAQRVLKECPFRELLPEWDQIPF
jgi:hypothetical protein